MVRVFSKENGKIQQLKENGKPDFSEFSDILWIDLHSPTDAEKEHVEEFFEINFQSKQQAQEIESSSRYLEQNDTILANSNFLVLQAGQYINHPVSFILRNNILFTYRNADLRSFAETVRKIKVNNNLFNNGTQIFLTLLETRIDIDADMIEAIARDIGLVSRQVVQQQNLEEDVLLKITSFQETTMLLRENIIDKQRVISAMIRSEVFPREAGEKLRIIIKDINSLLEHTAFSFERLEYLQNTFIGLVNIEQNKIIKIFTVASVVFMPPTLIASLYGMNFKSMPELGWDFGYPLAILLMVLSSLTTLYIFRRKKWL